MSTDWIFGYGSLMWNPCFPYQERRLATLHGSHRAFTQPSTRNWGNQSFPGPTLCLKSGGHLTGIAFRVRPEELNEILECLRKREGQDPEIREIQLTYGRAVRAYVWLMTQRKQWDDLSLDKLSQKAVDNHRNRQRSPGYENGDAVDYLRELKKNIDEMGINDEHVNAYWASVEARLEEES